MEEKEVHRRLKNALNMLIERDKFLLVMDANERSISHKLGVYLDLEFGEWDVDCEYNRVGEDHVKKSLDFEEIEKCYKNRQADSNEVAVYPDIIIHKRGKRLNLAIIEVKKVGNERGKECDLLKLQKYKRQLGYQFPFFVEFAIEGAPKYHVFDEEQREINL